MPVAVTVSTAHEAMETISRARADPHFQHILRYVRGRVSEPCIEVTERLLCIAINLLPLAQVDFDKPEEAFFFAYYHHQLSRNGRRPHINDIIRGFEFRWDDVMSRLASLAHLERPTRQAADPTLLSRHSIDFECIFEHVVKHTSEPRIAVTRRNVSLALGYIEAEHVDHENPVKIFLFEISWRHMAENGCPPSPEWIASAFNYIWDDDMTAIALVACLPNPAEF
ncbi:hypothetical protein LCI18_003527 [Fusarium solani-melongenae]|uniref:Uncharacterized protein n=1 Tax=Fusarium solani subsp. cucurbitae TaxID=2747967 RepID=A0ACD3YUE1_FUSSC|nr:hypothetical protein LCI18_003527 [Fusarium solani-melongenae]